MLSIIRNDHINMIQLLKILKIKSKLLEKDEEIDFRLIKTIITYLKMYSDKYHHPREDFIYDYYLNNCVADECLNMHLLDEHKLIREATIKIDELLTMILLDAVVSKDQFIEKLDNFIELQLRHINYEEQQVLPAIERTLSTADWFEIGLKWQQQEYHDPLFGDNVSTQYSQLAKIIKDM